MRNQAEQRNSVSEMSAFDRLREWMRARYAPELELDITPVPEGVHDQLDAFLKRLIETGVAAKSDLVGCSGTEIEQLETRYSVTLPASYRWYLTTMGKRSGRLFTHDHLAVYFSDVLSMTAEHREREIEFADKTWVELSSDALIIAGRLGEQFQFIHCTDPEDSPVWYFNEWDKQVARSKQSILDWLNSCCDDAQRAIARGYYDWIPNGTSP